jgi:hypothetical protein
MEERKIPEAKSYIRDLIFKIVGFSQSHKKTLARIFGFKNRTTITEHRSKWNLKGIEYYNLDQRQLEEYSEKARVILTRIAKQRTLITYDLVMHELGCGPGRKICGAIVRRVSEIELAEGRPKLSAVVIRSDTRMVGSGFFGLPGTPDSVKRFKSEEWQNPQLSLAEQEYWHDELKKVYEYWCPEVR